MSRSNLVLNQNQDQDPFSEKVKKMVEPTQEEKEWYARDSKGGVEIRYWADEMIDDLLE